MILRIIENHSKEDPGPSYGWFASLVRALGLLEGNDRVWVLEDAYFTWPEEMIEGQDEDDPPDCRISDKSRIVTCRTSVIRAIADSMSGDWTRIQVLAGELDPIADSVEMGSPLEVEILLECVDAAFWVVETLDPEIPERLRANGFTIQPLDRRHW